MSSPPPFSPYSTSTNPAFPLTSSLPRKRPSTASTPSNLNPAKRRKPSTSSSVHPLRQSSFPPADGPVSPSGSRVRASYSPSVDGASATERSTVSARGGKKSKKNTDGRSTRAPSTIIDSKNNNNRSTARTTARADDDNEASPPAPDDDDDAAEDSTALFTNAQENIDIEATTNRANMLMLHAAFSQDQQMRWEEWRRGKLEVKAIKRLANQTLSQSVGQGIVQAINAAAKMFVGEVVERAREVQGEWIGSGRERVVVKEEGKGLVKMEGTEINGTEAMAMNGTSQDETTRPPYQPLIQERDRGPLTPDHLREAVRRYKKDREGGSAGFVGRSLHGVEITAARTGGKRLFK